MLADRNEINPPADYANWWWVMALACLVLIVVLVLRTRRVLRDTTVAPAADAVAALRAETLTRIEEWQRAGAAGEVSARAVVGGLSAEVRRFVGIVSDGDADYATLPALRRDAVKDPRLVATVDFVAWAEPAIFDPTADIDPAAAYRRAREVVTSWH